MRNISKTYHRNDTGMAKTNTITEEKLCQKQTILLKQKSGRDTEHE